MPPKAKAKGSAAKEKAEAVAAGKARARARGLGKGGEAVPEGALLPAGPRLWLQEDVCTAAGTPTSTTTK